MEPFTRDLQAQSDLIKEVKDVISQTHTKEVAHRLGIEIQQFRNRISNQPQSKFGAFELLAILDVVPNPEPILRFVCDRYGYLAVPQKSTEVSNKDLLQLMIKSTKESGDVAGALIDAMQDGSISVTERKKILNEVEDMEIVAAEIRLAVEEK